MTTTHETHLTKSTPIPNFVENVRYVTTDADESAALVKRFGMTTERRRMAEHRGMEARNIAAMHGVGLDEIRPGRGDTGHQPFGGEGLHTASLQRFLTVDLKNAGFRCFEALREQTPNMDRATGQPVPNEISKRPLGKDGRPLPLHRFAHIFSFCHPTAMNEQGEATVEKADEIVEWLATGCWRHVHVFSNSGGTDNVNVVGHMPWITEPRVFLRAVESAYGYGRDVLPKPQPRRSAR